jgi:hypothetical protein
MTNDNALFKMIGFIVTCNKGNEKIMGQLQDVTKKCIKIDYVWHNRNEVTEPVKK